MTPKSGSTLATLLGLAALGACASTGATKGPVRLGQTADVNGPQVRANRVIEDSRCPVDAQCVWAGRLIVRATVLSGRSTRQVDLTLGAPVAIADGKLTLVEAVPDRRTAKQDSKPLPYRFTFVFQGGL